METLAAVELGVTELAKRVDLPKSTVARLLSTLEQLGAVERSQQGSRYRLGRAMITLAGKAGPSGRLISTARPQLVMLARAIGEDAGLSVPEGYRVLYIDQVEADNTVQVRDWTGEHVAMHAVPSGLVMLAAMPSAAVNRYLEGELESYTGNTMTDSAKLSRRLGRVRKEGYAWGREEFAEGINSIAAPVVDRRSRVVAAIHVHGPSYRFPAPGTETGVARQVVEAAVRMSEAIAS
jgi:DNA-binding IclR family transcriptional regulator